MLVTESTGWLYMICSSCKRDFFEGGTTSKVMEGAYCSQSCYKDAWTLTQPRFQLNEKYNLPPEHDSDYVDMQGPKVDTEGWTDR